MRTSNPILNRDLDVQILDGAPMTVSGAINKTLVLIICALIPAAAVWFLASINYIDKVSMIMTIGIIVGLISAFVIIFKNNTAPYLAPVYAFAEGAFLGGISVMLEARFPGIAIQAVTLTFGALLAMLALFRFKIVQATQQFKSTIFSAMCAIMVMYLVAIVASFFGVQLPFIYSGGPFGIAISVIICLVAAFSLIIDFDFIEKGAENMLPKYYEWYGAFGLMVTLVWLYMEILRLLSKIKDR